MAIELYFTRSNSEVPWGFRLAGGAEFNTPIQVTKVDERSIAKQAGLEVNDVLVRINNVPTSGITHSECNQLLAVSQNQLILAVRRDDLTPVTPELENDNEVSNIFEKTMQKEEKRVHFQNFTNELENVIEEGEPPQILSTLNVEQKEQKKWSTFLQKPRNPPPKPKTTEDKPKGDPYRVVIKKQKKKTAEKQKEVQKEAIPETVIEKEETPQDENDNNNNNETNQTETREEISEDEEATIEDDSEIDDESRRSDKFDNEPAKSATEKFLEEKLAAVQKQLEALSQLPTAIQLTLNAVTKELTNIIKIKEGNYEEIEEKVSDDENTATEREASNDFTSENSDSSKSEEELYDESSGAYQQIYDEDDKSENLEEGQEQLHNDNEEEELDVEREPEPEPDPDENLTEEEKEAKRLERERLDKQQKIEEYQQLRLGQRPTVPLKPIQRPIILPGGRRWSQPDDACPTIRQPKMSDEKIANTIETFSEVIVGKTKGINFLKYQPPPKKLEHLQRSEVYKLVHDLEPPVRGICNRAEKILSEQDYYQNIEA